MKKLEVALLYSLVYGTNLDDIVYALQSVKNDSIIFYYDFLGHRLYSDIVTLDDAYKEVYNMNRHDYREALKVLFESDKTRKEILERKIQIDERAKRIISKDHMRLFDESLFILVPYGINCISYKKVQLFLELLEQLNKDDYLLDDVKKLYSKIQPRNVLSNNHLLKNIKELSINGNALFKELYDEEAELGVRNAQLLIPHIDIDSHKREQPEDESMSRYDKEIS